MGSVYEWRDPEISRQVDPLPPPGAYVGWEDAVMDYFAKSLFFDEESLTAVARRGLDAAAAERLFATRGGTYYVVEDEGGLPVVKELENEARNDRVVRTEVTAYYSIVHGTVVKARTAYDAVAAALRMVARRLHEVLAFENEARVTKMESAAAALCGDHDDAEEEGGKPAKKQKRTGVHSAGPIIGFCLGKHEDYETRRARAEQEQHLREAERLRAQEAAATAAAAPAVVASEDEFMSVTKEPDPLSFVDAKTKSTIVLRPAVKKIHYTVDGDPRPPITKLLWMPAKRVLKFPLINKGTTLQEEDAGRIVKLVAAMCDYCSVVHNIQA